MLDLALHEQCGSVQCRDIAGRQEIPEPYLNQLLSALRRAQLIVSRRGPGGGHQLARSADSILLGEIVDALDGSEVMEARSDTSCACALADVWRDVGLSARRILDETTLATLAGRVRERNLTYSI